MNHAVDGRSTRDVRVDARAAVIDRNHIAVDKHLRALRHGDAVILALHIPGHENQAGGFGGDARLRGRYGVAADLNAGAELHAYGKAVTDVRDGHHVAPDFGAASIRRRYALQAGIDVPRYRHCRATAQQQAGAVLGSRPYVSGDGSFRVRVGLDAGIGSRHLARYLDFGAFCG
ncbi:MAG: hypothetical protein BWY57_03127 [Betaproteobacteria bacterium ADurb.Bin341]|nr:MAG: hypothetical protein BWY57_03127 [Betaproteobacteria bacterium ADurb.Bin341]